MTGYFCRHCPLAFEVGYDVYSDLTGGYSQYVCCGCGAMHRIEHRIGKPDVVFAQAAPIRAMVDVEFESADGTKHTTPWVPYEAVLWNRISELTTSEALRHESVLPKRIRAIRFDELACSVCGRVGSLVSNEWPTDANGNWPIFGECCPVCRKEIQLVYVCT